MDTSEPTGLDETPGMVPATLKIVDRVGRGRVPNNEAWLAGIHGDLKKHPGFISVDVIRQLDLPRPEYLILVKFAAQVHLEAWQDSDEARLWLARLEKIVDEAPQLEQALGLEIWFDRGSTDAPQMPAFWKRVLLSIGCVYPMILLLDWAMSPLSRSLPPEVQILIVVVPLSILLTWPVMPVASRLLRRWLYPLRPGSASN